MGLIPHHSHRLGFPNHPILNYVIFNTRAGDPGVRVSPGEPATSVAG